MTRTIVFGMYSDPWPKPSWSQDALQEARDRIVREPEGSIWTVLCRVRLAAAAGDLAGARANLQALYLTLDARRVGLEEVRQILPLALLTQEMSGLEDLLRRLWPTPAVECRFQLSAQPDDAAVATLRVDGDRATFVMDRALFTAQHGEILLLRLMDLFPILAVYLESPLRSNGTIALNLGDVGHRPGLTFSDARPGYFLVPDTCFMQSGGYSAKRAMLIDRPIPWRERRSVALWRGTTTGHQGEAGWQQLPRIRLCQRAAMHSDLIDAGITGLVQIAEVEGARQWLHERGLLRDHIEPEAFQAYRYQIDIDGNSNSWPGLFLKLLTGSTVLKVPSPLNLRQWYYDRLSAWINFVPLEPDLSDLADKIRWLRTHDDTARAIGAAGQDLARSLTYEGEIANAAVVVEAARRSASAP